MDPLQPRKKEEFLAGLEIVKELEKNEFESYSIVRDRESGQHYLHFFLSHINLSEGGRRDNYDHFLPLASDDVLGFIFEEQPYHFPDHWRSPYLRSGNDERLVPFDPSENYDLEADAAAELAMVEKLEAFKQQWALAENMSPQEKEKLTMEYFRQLDKIFQKPEE